MSQSRSDLTDVPTQYPLRRRREAVTALEVIERLKARNWVGAVRDIERVLDEICGDRG